MVDTNLAPEADDIRFIRTVFDVTQTDPLLPGTPVQLELAGLEEA